MSISFLKNTDKTPKLLAMVHVKALPGTARYTADPKEIIEHAVAEAKLLTDAGVDGIILENMHDIPYLNGAVGPEVIAMMTRVGTEVKKVSNLPCGIQILAAANREALAAAQAAGLDFIRAEGFVFAHVADEGIIESNAGELLRYRKMIGAEEIAVLTDIKKKHSAHTITADVDLVETAKAAAFFLSDGLILTGAATGSPADADELLAAKSAVDLPVIIGSGITVENLQLYREADALIVGSYLKKGGHWTGDLDAQRVRLLVEALEKL